MTGTDAPDVVIITGMSGAGRSTAAKSLEDLDWFVADNLPPGLLPTMIELASRAMGAVPRVAAVLDVRSRAFSTDLQSAIGELDARGHPAPGRLPGGQRRHPGPPVRERPAPASAAGGRPGGGRHRGRADPAPRRPGGSRPGHRHLRAERARAAGPDARRVQRRGAGRAPGQRGVLRLQVRAAGGRRHRGRLPVPAQPALGPRPGPADRAGRAGPGLRAAASPARPTSWTPTWPRSGWCWPGTSGKASGSPRWPSAAPAASTAASRWPSRSPASSGSRDRRSRYCTGTWGASDAGRVSWPGARGTAAQPQGGRARRRARPVRLAVRAAPGDPAAQRDRDGGRRRRVQRQAAPPVRRAAAR